MSALNFFLLLTRLLFAFLGFIGIKDVLWALNFTCKLFAVSFNIFCSKCRTDQTLLLSGIVLV